MHDYREFNTATLKPMFVKILEQITVPTHVMAPLLNVINPSGFSADRSTRTTKRAVYRHCNLVNSVDGVYAIKRTVHSAATSSLSLIVNRSYVNQHTQHYSYQKVFSDKFQLVAVVTDKTLALAGVDSSLYEFRFSTGWLAHDRQCESFEEFITKRLPEDFNDSGSEVMDVYTAKKSNIQRLLVGASKYL